MSGIVVNLSELRERRAQREQETAGDGVPGEGMLRETEKANRKNKKRMAKDRARNNRSVLREYGLPYVPTDE